VKSVTKSWCGVVGEVRTKVFGHVIENGGPFGGEKKEKKDNRQLKGGVMVMVQNASPPRIWPQSAKKRTKEKKRKRKKSHIHPDFSKLGLE